MLIPGGNPARLFRAALAFFRFSPGRLAVLFALMAVQGATAGIGLLALLPLLHLAGLAVDPGPAAGLADGVSRAFSFLGLPPRLETLLAFYVIIVIAISTSNYGQAVLSARAQQRYTGHLRGRLHRQLLRSRWQFILSRKMSDFVHALGSQVQATGLASQLMLSMASRTVLLAAMVLLALLLSWRMSLLALGFAGLLLAVLLPLNRRIYGSGEARLVGFKAVFQLLSEQLAGLKLIKSRGGEDWSARQLDRIGESLEAQNVRLARMHALTQWIYTVSAVAASAAFAYAALARFAVPLPELLLLLLILSRLLPQVLGLQKTWQQLLHQLPAFEDLERLARECEAERESGTGGTGSPPVLARSIVLRDVSYRYPGAGRDILRGISAEIRKNRTVALVGPSGVGKSTLADLLAGLLEPSSGTIQCDGLPLDGERRIAWRRALAYVTQEVFLFHDTVRANLAWAAEGCSEASMWEALRDAAADGFVARLPQGLDTVIGDRGVRLSGGERQRLALARALLGKPQLLILDEATSALDPGNEERIRQALERLNGRLTIILISHREGTLEQADERIELEAVAV